MDFLLWITNLISTLHLDHAFYCMYAYIVTMTNNGLQSEPTNQIWSLAICDVDTQTKNQISEVN